MIKLILYKKIAYISLALCFTDLVVAMEEIQTTKTTAQPMQDPRMVQGTNMSHYVASLQEKFPQASKSQLENHINAVLDAKSNQSTWFGFQKTPIMTPEDVTNYKPSTLNDPGSLSFIQLTENTKPNNTPIATEQNLQLTLYDPSKNAQQQNIQQPPVQAEDTSPDFTYNDQGNVIYANDAGIEAPV